MGSNEATGLVNVTLLEAPVEAAAAVINIDHKPLVKQRTHDLHQSRLS